MTHLSLKMHHFFNNWKTRTLSLLIIWPNFNRISRLKRRNPPPMPKRPRMSRYRWRKRWNASRRSSSRSSRRRLRRTSLLSNLITRRRYRTGRMRCASSTAQINRVSINNRRVCSSNYTKAKWKNKNWGRLTNLPWWHCKVKLSFSSSNSKK